MGEQRVPPGACSAAPCGTGSTFAVLGQRSTPLPQSPLRCTSSSLSTKHCPPALPEPTAQPSSCCWRNLMALPHPVFWPHQSVGAKWAAQGTSPGHRKEHLALCTASETQLAGHGRCRHFQSFPVLSHTLSMGVWETKKLSSLLSAVFPLL